VTPESCVKAVPDGIAPRFAFLAVSSVPAIPALNLPKPE
jgi:hypothetical protein